MGLAAQPPFAFPMVDSQGALDITSDGRLLFAVNAGSNSISSFKVTSTGAQLVDTISSGGTEPISLTHAGRLLYVLNEDSGNIAGFRFSDDGDLSSIPHSSQSLATPGRGGVSAQIGFTPDRRFLTVTERCFQTCSLAPFGLIDTFRMGWDGRPGLVQAHPSDAPIPFGFAYQGRHLITTYVGYVATPSGATPNPADADQFNGFIGSDTLNWWGGLSPNGTVPAGGAFQVGRGTCWIAITGDGKYTFVTNSLSDTRAQHRERGRRDLAGCAEPERPGQCAPAPHEPDPDSAGRLAFPTDDGGAASRYVILVSNRVRSLSARPPRL